MKPLLILYVLTISHLVVPYLLAILFFLLERVEINVLVTIFNGDFFSFSFLFFPFVKMVLKEGEYFQFPNARSKDVLRRKTILTQKSTYLNIRPETKT